jgi:hypothetical protein
MCIYRMPAHFMARTPWRNHAVFLGQIVIVYALAALELDSEFPVRSHNDQLS